MGLGEEWWFLLGWGLALAFTSVLLDLFLTAFFSPNMAVLVDVDYYGEGLVELFLLFGSMLLFLMCFLSVGKKIVWKYGFGWG